MPYAILFLFEAQIGEAIPVFRENSPQQLFRLLGLAAVLPAVLLSGPVAGYLVSRWLIQKWNFIPESTMILVLLGLLGSSLQAIRIWKHLYRESGQH